LRKSPLAPWQKASITCSRLVISWHGLLIATEINGKLQRWLWFPCNAARLEPLFVGVRGQMCGRPEYGSGSGRSIKHGTRPIDLRKAESLRADSRSWHSTSHIDLSHRAAHALPRHALQCGPEPYCHCDGSAEDLSCISQRAADSKRATPPAPIDLLQFSRLPVPGTELFRSAAGWLRQQLAAADVGHRLRKI
jgi:hypothetical protein